MAKKLTPLLQENKLTAPVFISLANEQDMGVEELIKAFESSAPKSLNWQYQHYPNENHFSTALPALYDGLQFLAPNYAVDGSEMVTLGDYQQVLAHFKVQQKQWAGFQLANGFNKKKNHSKAFKLLNSVKAKGESFPGWHKQMSIYYTGIEKPALAKKHQEIALKLAKQYQF